MAIEPSSPNLQTGVQTDPLSDIVVMGLSLLAIPHQEHCHIDRPESPKCTCPRDETLHAWGRVVQRLRKA